MGDAPAKTAKLFHKRFISSDRGRLLSGTLINASPFSSRFKIMGSVHKALINSYSLGDIPPLFPSEAEIVSILLQQIKDAY